MDQYVGLDVSQKETVICVIDEKGKQVWEGVCSSTPEAIAAVSDRKAPQAVKIGMETGPLAVWHWHALRSAGLPSGMPARASCQGSAVDAVEQD